MTVVPMVGLTACEATSVVNPNDGANILVVCVLPPGHAGAHWARVTEWAGEPYEWHTTIPRPRKAEP